ncbi:MAG: DUF134 domain-containing protein [Proteiniphilum sp.]|nr:DUF134 domain-containing protein [Proteiniphilum sp.]
MPRPKQNRKMAHPPLMQGFKPFGIPRKMLRSVSLLFEEYEAIRLLDYKGMTQDQAAGEMNISRPTLTRIYEKARRTIAMAFVEGMMINIEGGNVQFDTDWYRCRRCFKLIDGLGNHQHCSDCDFLDNDELIPIQPDQQ